MNRNQREFVERIARQVLGDEKFEELRQIPFQDLGFGYDQFGMERESSLAAYLVARILYERYFRVESRGNENVPKTGRAILAANHSGTIPIDGMMIGVDLLEKGVPPRAMRAVFENFVPKVPFVGLFFTRAGQVVGHRRNFEELLKAGEFVVVFPEGAKGTGKLFRDRYKLVRFNVGFMELSLLHQAPLIPCAVIGGEEQMPILFKSKALAKLFDIPYVPITPTFPLLGPLGLLPYPTKYYIQYGEPLHYYKEYGPDAVKHPDLIRRLADEYQEIVQQMINDGLKQRESIF